MQIGKVQRLLHRIPDGEKHNTKVFIEMVNMYYEDKKQFDAILLKAKGETQPVKSNRELFVEWLSEKVSPSRLSDYYMVFSDIDDYAKKKKITTGAFFETTDSATSLKLLNSINADKIFRFTHKRQMRSIVDVSQFFHKYTKENEAQRTAADIFVSSTVSLNLQPEPECDPVIKTEQKKEYESTQTITAHDAAAGNQETDINQRIPQAQDINEIERSSTELKDTHLDTLIIDFKNDISYAFTKPVSLSYFGEKVFETSWENLYVRVCGFLIDDYPDDFSDLRDASASGERKCLVYDAENAKRLTTPVEISEGYFVETNGDTADLIHNIKDLLDICRVDYENLVIQYVYSSEKPDAPVMPLQRSVYNKNSVLEHQEPKVSGEADLKEHKAKYRDPVIEFLVDNGIEYIDKRYNLGCLWIVGGAEISEVISKLKRAGVSLHFKASGGVATQGRDAWWTKDNTDNITVENASFESSLEDAAQADESRLISAAQGRDAFSAWLHTQGLTDGSIRTSLWAFSKVNEYAVRSFIISGSLFEITSVPELDRIWNRLICNDEFVEYRRKNGVVSFAFNKYRAFRSADEATPSSADTRKLVQRVINPGDSADSRREAFVSWMETQGFSLSTCLGYASAIATASDFATSENILTKPLYEIDSYFELISNCKRLQASNDFLSFNRSHHNRFSAAINRYLEFRKAIDESPLVPVVDQGYGVLRMPDGLTPAQGREEFEKWLETSNCPSGSIKTYADSVEITGRFLNSQGYDENNIFTITDVPRLESFRSMLRDDDDFKKERRSSISLDLHALKRYIGFRQATSSSKTVDDKSIEKFSRILRDNFDNGFRPNSIIDQKRFRQYYEECYGEELKESDAEVVRILARIGTRQDDRIFIHNGSTHGSLLEEIKSSIRSAFAEGASCVYYSEIYARYQEMLASQLQVFSLDVMKELLLSSSDEEFRAGKGFFYTKRATPNADDDIRRFLKGSPTPLNYAALHEHLWYIPLDIIKRCLVTTSDIVNVAQETYFYAPNLPVSVEELNHIAELIHGQLGQKSFVTDLEMRTLIENNCPSVAINTESYTTWGLRNCLSVLLQDRFAFVGPIISEKGRSLNTSQVFAEFSRSHDLMTLDELKSFAKDINNGIIYWDSVLDVMVRISQDEFVPKGQIVFDVEATDSVLDELMDGDYAPLKSFRLFLHYPAISVRWNEFVLESYVAGYSKKFSLMHASYTATECCGAIVRKESEIKDFQGLVTDVLAHSDSWQTKNDALAVLVNQGYIQRRHYTKIDMIIPKAKQHRKQVSTMDHHYD